MQSFDTIAAWTNFDGREHYSCSCSQIAGSNADEGHDNDGNNGSSETVSRGSVSLELGEVV